MHMPADGDADNAASVAQDFKVTADFLAWLMSPRAKASDWATAVMRYKDARLNDRFIVDHYGLPGGELLEWREDFGRRTDWSLSGAGTASIGKWVITQTGAASAISGNGPGISAGINFSDTHPVLKFDIDDAAANTSEMLIAASAHTAIWSPNNLVELDYKLAPHVVTDVTWVHGVCGLSEHINTIANGAFFIRNNAPGSTWHARTIQGGTPTDVDTGVAGTADTSHHFKIIIAGSGIDDASAARAVFLVDGVVKANITTNIPATGTHIQPIWGGFSGGGAAGNQSMLLAPPHWVQITRSATP
jgi:hypothetical protein